MSIVGDPPTGYVGQVMRRKEDPRLITGRARYIDDISLPGTLWAAIVRSPEAHARIVSIDTTAAAEYPGVHAVFTGEDMSDLAGPLPCAWVPPGVEVQNPEHWPLARGTVNHVGDPVAVVLGDDRYAVVDAAEEVLVEYESLPAIVDPEKALEGPPFVHESIGTNKVHEWSLPGGDVEAGFAEADTIVERRAVNHRIAGAPIEPRGVLADYRAGSLTLWTSTQVSHFVRLFMALLLGSPRITCGSSRPRAGVASAPSCRSTGRSCQHAAHPADSVAGCVRDGRLLQIPNVQTDIIGVFTNKCPTDAIRGAGRPEATHMLELTLDVMAHELGIDRLEIRRKNFIPKEDFPAAVATGVIYDSGDYVKTLDTLLEHVNVAAFTRSERSCGPRGSIAESGSAPTPRSAAWPPRG